MASSIQAKENGYRGIWYTLGQFSEYGDKYSGGLGTYTAKHNPLAVYSAQANKTFFVWGGRTEESNSLINCVSYYDHTTGQVPRPTRVRTVGGTDNHKNACISIDDSGYVWVFASGRNTSLNESRYRSVAPMSIDSFELVESAEKRTYPQVWYTPGEGFLALFTRYIDGRELYWHSSRDGRVWTPERKLAGFGGHYQTSFSRNGRVVTAFNWHGNGGSDARTNLYCLQTVDQGESWQTTAASNVATPLTSSSNAALVRDYAAEDLLVYLKDINLDENDRPVVLYITSATHLPGPVSPSRMWTIAAWDGNQWLFHEVAPAMHCYDMGSLYIEPGGTWRLIAPVEQGPQQWGTGGEISVWESDDRGATWHKVDDLTSGSERNHSYVRRPLNAHPDFAAFWCDGNPDQGSESHIYFAGDDGTVRELPYNMEGDFAVPQVVQEGGAVPVRNSAAARAGAPLARPSGVLRIRPARSGTEGHLDVSGRRVTSSSKACSYLLRQ